MATVAASTQECSNAVLEQAHSVQSREELTKTQREIVEKTWGPISSDLQAAGILLFKRIFEIAPAAIQLFPKFKDVPIENLEKNEDFRHHALQVPEAVGLAVSYLGDLESLYSVLKDLGALHADFGIQDAHFEIVGEALIWTLQTALDSDFTSEVKDAWVSFYGMVSTHMKIGLHEAYDAKDD